MLFLSNWTFGAKMQLAALSLSKSHQTSRPILISQAITLVCFKMHQQIRETPNGRIKPSYEAAISHLGAIVIDALRCSLIAGAKRFVLWKSESNVFCLSPHERFIRSETSVFMISEGDVSGAAVISTVSFGLQIENGKGYLSQFGKCFCANRYLLWCGGRRRRRWQRCRRIVFDCVPWTDAVHDARWFESRFELFRRLPENSKLFVMNCGAALGTEFQLKQLK